MLRPLDPYFEAFERADADFVHFATDMVQVYQPGPLRERMIAEHDVAGFSSGTFRGRGGQLDGAKVRAIAATTGPLRSEFVDNLEQTLINYCVDVSGLHKADANDLVDDLAVAGALMRLTGSGDDLKLADRRVPYSGRNVSMIHWAGYSLSSLMPYRRTFLRYRLAGLDGRQRLRYRIDQVLSGPRHAAATLPRPRAESVPLPPTRLAVGARAGEVARQPDLTAAATSRRLRSRRARCFRSST